VALIILLDTLIQMLFAWLYKLRSSGTLHGVARKLATGVSGQHLRCAISQKSEELIHTAAEP
jgi:hypothetical protein